MKAAHPSFYEKTDYDRELAALPPALGAEPYRLDFRKDFSRVVHSPAFRRLQGKTQLFPGDESDFFRNRLTHSLEVAQIAKSIALRLNHMLAEEGRAGDGISPDLVEFAGLAHDLGHPPFGHTGEHALHGRMAAYGGFEGNAQTLRILTRLEKRFTRQSVSNDALGPDFTEFAKGKDLRVGLNLCYRSLAAILKYDRAIPILGRSGEVLKGYYESEGALVAEIRRRVLREHHDEMAGKELQVVEMQIMDLADDIAYSTYDLEDALKAGFGSPLYLLQQVNDNEELRDAVAAKLFKSDQRREYHRRDASPGDVELFEDIQRKMVVCVMDLLERYLAEVDASIEDDVRIALREGDQKARTRAVASLSVTMQKLSHEVSSNGYVRADFTSQIVGSRIREVGIDFDAAMPCLSRIKISERTRFEIDVLKHMTFELQIKSPRLQLIEYRGKQIVEDLFDCFDEDTNGELLPQDWRERLKATRDYSDGEMFRKRLICDYIAGMTDSYALDLYSRLKSASPSVLFRPT